MKHNRHKRSFIKRFSARLADWRGAVEEHNKVNRRHVERAVKRPPCATWSLTFLLRLCILTLIHTAFVFKALHHMQLTSILFNLVFMAVSKWAQRVVMINVLKARKNCFFILNSKKKMESRLSYKFFPLKRPHSGFIFLPSQLIGNTSVEGGSLLVCVRVHTSPKLEHPTPSLLLFFLVPPNTHTHTHTDSLHLLLIMGAASGQVAVCEHKHTHTQKNIHNVGTPGMRSAIQNHTHTHAHTGGVSGTIWL